MENRVAPRCTGADSMLVATISRGRILSHQHVPAHLGNTIDLLEFLRNHGIDTLVCGGISRQLREALSLDGVETIDNVAGSVEEIITALSTGDLRSGFGLKPSKSLKILQKEMSRQDREGHQFKDSHQPEHAGIRDKLMQKDIDCLKCIDKRCLRGENCCTELLSLTSGEDDVVHRVLEATADISQEVERRLCRLSELVYFCLEMEYEKIGIAFCIDLLEPAEILSSVFRRFFEVIPVCCKIGGSQQEGYGHDVFESITAGSIHSVACNPVGQACVLNSKNTDLNVAVGLCVGADCLFSQASEAPVTTLFVKDRSLANNPIGAVYSEYHLQESLAPSSKRPVKNVAIRGVHGGNTTNRNISRSDRG
ncbi:DUF1847 domain-containing protein [Acidobacteriota bacterium]